MKIELLLGLSLIVLPPLAGAGGQQTGSPTSVLDKKNCAGYKETRRNSMDNYPATQEALNRLAKTNPSPENANEPQMKDDLEKIKFLIQYNIKERSCRFYNVSKCIERLETTTQSNKNAETPRGTEIEKCDIERTRISCRTMIDGGVSHLGSTVVAYPKMANDPEGGSMMRDWENLERIRLEQEKAVGPMRSALNCPANTAAQTP